MKQSWIAMMLLYIPAIVGLNMEKMKKIILHNAIIAEKLCVPIVPGDMDKICLIANMESAKNNLVIERYEHVY